MKDRKTKLKRAEKRIDKIEELKKDVMVESKAGKMLQDLEYEKIEIISTIVDKMKSIKKTNKLFASCFKNVILKNI